MIFEQSKSRPLTQGEIAIAQSVFGDTLDTSNIRIKTAWWVLKNYAVSPNGNIYFNRHDWLDDFSHQPLELRAWLVHELTHIWQLQQGIAVFRKALFNRRYSYTLCEGKGFLSYGVEQQARMVEDMYKQRERGQANPQLLALIPFCHQPSMPSLAQNPTDIYHV
ncbi:MULTISPECIES: type IV secretion protein Rhs [unclassified Moraxella]|uniref:type IV secretion protein Rhs n=1 Tax=unclassified Moraxella TaxID=2685852 RepID=UPI003AF43E03